jgi:hypothetical protein
MNTVVKKFLTNMAKSGLLVLLPLLLISNRTTIDRPLVDFPDEGTYTLWATGGLNKELTGHIRFHTYNKVAIDGKPFSVLEFKMGCKEETQQHTMGIYISKKSIAKDLIGKYKIGKNSDGLLSAFEGVFVYIDIGNLGETPFFAAGGEINIANSKDDKISGDINMSLTNFEGRTMRVSGSFVALASR